MVVALRRETPSAWRGWRRAGPTSAPAATPSAAGPSLPRRGRHRLCGQTRAAVPLHHSEFGQHAGRCSVAGQVTGIDWLTVQGRFGLLAKSPTNRSRKRVCLRDFLAGWSLAGQKKGLDQLAFAADDQFRKPFEPLPVWDFGLRVHPPQHKPELLGRNTALLNTVQQVIVQRRRQIMAANLRHESFAVEPTLHRGLQSNDFCRVS